MVYSDCINLHIADGKSPCATKSPNPYIWDTPSAGLTASGLGIDDCVIFLSHPEPTGFGNLVNCKFHELLEEFRRLGRG